MFHQFPPTNNRRHLIDKKFAFTSDAFLKVRFCNVQFQYLTQFLLGSNLSANASKNEYLLRAISHFTVDDVPNNAFLAAKPCSSSYICAILL